jgi:LPS-assembly lipoprotein
MKRLLVLALTFAVAGCGLHPLYQGGSAGYAAEQGLGGVEVSAISGKAGWLMRDALVTRLGAVPGGGAARYRLDVRLDDKLEGLGLLANDTVGRERRTLRARYQLVEVSTGVVMLDASAGSDAGFDVVSSEYATVAAEQTALENLTRVVADKIITNLAIKLRAQGVRSTAP